MTALFQTPLARLTPDPTAPYNTPMLLLALFLPPLALYLIVLGWINRGPRPVMVSGTWDFAGVLFAVSGFVLAGGPALLGSLDERSRLFWLLGETGAAGAGPHIGTFWIAVRLFYFALVAGGAAALLWRARRLTSVYNVESPTVVSALEQAFQRLGLTPIRSGDSYTSIGGPTVQVDAFPLMRHVTLRWEPADSATRREVERELRRALAEGAPPERESILGWLLLMLGVTLVLFALFGAVLAVLHDLYPR